MPPERLKQLEQMAQENPDDRELRYFLATEYFQSGRYQDSLNELDRYFRDGDDEGVGYKMKGICLFHLGRRDEARAALQSGIAAAQKHRHSGLAAEIEETLEELSRP